uniref:Ig-like domain-containing protein n=1 Tax=Pelodiscus sinensis TaxID=13735 RepID=K7F696_PELSI
LPTILPRAEIWRTLSGLSLTPCLFLPSGLLVGSLEYNQPADNYTVCQGDNATLSACGLNGEKTPMSWSVLREGSQPRVAEPRVPRLALRLPARITNISSAVTVNEGSNVNLLCMATGKPEPTVTWRQLRVPARITNISSAVTVNEGSNVNLLCMATGKPEPTVTWRQLRDGFTSEGEYLEITEINRQQAGEYECITANGVSMADTKRVLITVNYPPTIKDVKDAYPPMGKPALLRCEAMAVPAAEFEWFKDEKQLFGGLEGLRIRNERTRSMLLIDNVTARHYGNYTCLASNKLGASNASLRLIRPGSLENIAVTGMESPLFLGLLSSAFVTLLFKI